MSKSLRVVPDSQGLPAAEIPFTCMWDLVEYLSFQRVVASYHYEASHFTVTFPRIDADTAQRILDSWTQSRNVLLQTA